MKKTYIQPRTEQFLLAPTCMLAASVGSTWTPDHLPDDYEEIELDEESRIPDQAPPPSTLQERGCATAYV